MKAIENLGEFKEVTLEEIFGIKWKFHKKG